MKILITNFSKYITVEITFEKITVSATSKNIKQALTEAHAELIHQYQERYR